MGLDSGLLRVRDSTTAARAMLAELAADATPGRRRGARLLHRADAASALHGRRVSRLRRAHPRRELCIQDERWDSQGELCRGDRWSRAAFRRDRVRRESPAGADRRAAGRHRPSAGGSAVQALGRPAGASASRIVSVAGIGEAGEAGVVADEAQAVGLARVGDQRHPGQRTCRRGLSGPQVPGRLPPNRDARCS